jgi:murein DD-endopeptidase MepM/ murein hydrolase activator NlpD
MAAILNQPALIEKENAEVAALVSPRTPEQMWSGKFRQPATGIATARFGTRRGYNGSAPSACGHEGMDIAAQPGTPVSADARGRVVFAGLTQVRGNLVIVDHGLGVYTGYYHLSAIAVKVGQVVERGDLVGKVGSTGFSTGAHLHWSMWVNGEYVDPLEWTKRVIP